MNLGNRRQTIKREIKFDDISIGGNANPRFTVPIQTDRQTTRINTDLNDLQNSFDESKDNSNQSKMTSYGFGLNYNYRQHLSFNAEVYELKSFKPYDYLNIFSFQNPNIKSKGLGLNYILNDKNDYYDSLNLRMGTYIVDYIYGNV